MTAFFLALIAVKTTLALQLENYGDSLSVAFLAQSTLKSPPPLDGVGEILTNLSMYKITGEEKYIAPYKKPENTWGYMLSQKLNASVPTTFVNKAHEGDRSTQIPYQVSSVPATKEQTLGFIFIGHNDLCSPGDTVDAVSENFEQRLAESVKIWDSKHENSKLYLVQTGDVPQVFDLLEKVVWAKSEQFTFTCKYSWKKIFPYCPYFARLHQDGKMHEKLDPILKRMNQSIEKIAKDWSTKPTTNQFFVLDTSNRVKYSVEDFSVDCFHLSKIGQAKLADLVLKDLNL